MMNDQLQKSGIRRREEGGGRLTGLSHGWVARENEALKSGDDRLDDGFPQRWLEILVLKYSKYGFIKNGLEGVSVSQR
jgi:hypothetical protein